MSLLQMKNISKAFSGVFANDNISLTVEKGEIHALLGENGAGKTTLVNILFGIYTADSGEIFWKGEKVDLRSPKEAIEKGIGMVQQHFSLVRKMSVLDNVIMNLRGNSFFLDRKAARRRLVELGGRYGLHVDPDALVCDLSVGEQQRVEILKALYRDVELLILDEPTGVLTPQETEHFFQILRKLKAEGYGIVIITHRMSEIMEISDRVTILRDGKQVAELTTSGTNPEELSRYMIGRSLKDHYDLEQRPERGTMLELRQICLPHSGSHKALHNISLSVRKGEILGIAGVEGNGQKELAEIIAGVRRPDSGTVLLDGADVTHLNARRCHEAGISYISDDRLRDSLVTPLDVQDNLILKDFRKEPFSRNMLMDQAAVRSEAEKQTAAYQIRTSGRTGVKTPVRLMSGGNQQKLIIARELSERSRLIVASQPTRGLDIGATEFVRECLVKQRNAGKGILLISADLEEILELSDRIAVLFGGRIAGILDRKDATQQKLGLLMGGIQETEVTA